MTLPLCEVVFVCVFFVSVGLIANLMSFSAKKQLSNLHFNEQHIDGDVLVTAKCVCVNLFVCCVSAEFRFALMVSCSGWKLF